VKFRWICGERMSEWANTACQQKVKWLDLIAIFLPSI